MTLNETGKPWLSRYDDGSIWRVLMDVAEEKSYSLPFVKLVCSMLHTTPKDRITVHNALSAFIALSRLVSLVDGCGPNSQRQGGVRYHAHVTREEVVRRGRWCSH